MSATYSGLRVSVTSKTTTYTLLTTDCVLLCDTSGGSWTASLPASPDEGQTYFVKHAVGGGTLTISGNGNPIDGDVTLVSATEGDCPMLVYTTATGWKVI